KKIKDNSWLISVVPSVLLLVLGVALFVFMMKQTGGGGKYSSFGKANIKNQGQNNGKKVTFADVAGADEEKHEMEEIVDFLKNPKKYSEIGARIPKGVLLLGPPGTGKTLLAKAVAGEAGCPFFPISGSDFVEMFVGVGASRVRDLFEQAKKNAPSIIFIDEIDAVGRHRGAGLGGGHDEREQTLNQLLVEMDGFTGNESVIVIAATNRRDILDPALLRPGRFDRQIVVGYPDIKGREEILKVHTKNKPLAPDVNLKTIAKTTVGFTGADLENLVNEASLLAARANRKAIIREDIEEATIKVIAGPEKKSRVVTEREKKLTSYHEAGHAVCTYYCPTQDKVHQVSIIPRGMAGGFTMSLPEHDKSYVSKTEMKENIVTLLGGRVAEKLILEDISTGASNDIERATGIARNMVTKYGFSDKLGPMVYGNDQSEVFLGRDFNSSRNYSENVAAEIDAEMREIIEEGYEKSKELLEQHIDQLHFLAKYLMKYEKIDDEDFEKLMKGEMDESVLKEDELENQPENETEENSGSTGESSEDKTE
ncbi:MAG: ATP-dependent zinc metalloprotease FtsH, partial [Porcipelethomonas sp.]